MSKPFKVDNWSRFIQDLCYPRRCVLCQGPASGRDLCTACAAELPWNEPACPRCAHPLPPGVVGLCGHCQRQPPPFERALAAFRYAYPIDRLLQGLKFHQQLHLAPLLGDLLAERLEARADPLPECLIPVPLHRRRLRTRGYNQALELARPLARRLGLALAPGVVQRLRATRVQSELKARERRANLRGAFRLQGPLAARHVAIVDDVVSTASTVGELARVLKRAGVERVEVWSCARTPRRN